MWQPTSVFLPGKFHGQRSLVGSSPWGHKELNTTERNQIQISLSEESNSQSRMEVGRDGGGGGWGVAI